MTQHSCVFNELWARRAPQGRDNFPLFFFFFFVFSGCRSYSVPPRRSKAQTHTTWFHSSVVLSPPEITTPAGFLMVFSAPPRPQLALLPEAHVVIKTCSIESLTWSSNVWHPQHRPLAGREEMCVWGGGHSFTRAEWNLLEWLHETSPLSKLFVPLIN